jgi:signal transduction histidine kinase
MLERARFSPYLRGSTATAMLLGLALLLAGMVAWRARAAAAAHRAAVQRLLEDHASYAAAEFSRRAGAILETAAASLQAPAAGLQAFEDSVRGRDLCDCLSLADGFFALDPATGSLTVDGDSLGPQASRWVRDQVAAQVRWLSSNPTQATGAAAQLRTVDGRPALLAFTIRDGRAYGLLTDPAPILDPVFRRVMAEVPLLPGSVMRGAANDSLIRVSVVGPDGGELWSSAPAGWSDARAEESFPPEISGLSTRVEIRPEAAPRLLRGGLPASPQPLLLAMMALSIGVVAVALLQMRRQHELSRMRADFVSGVSHELRTPITQIRLFTELLLGGRLRTDQERQHSLGLIERETRRLTFLVERILDFSRSERGALTVRPTLIDAHPVLREALDGFEPVARARGMSIRGELGSDLVAPLDAHALRHVLLNFLENAVKYGPAGQIIRVGGERRDGAIRVWVEDGGPGVPAEERRRIWEAYYRLDRPADRVAGGSGIGLSLVRDLVTRHGGRAWVEDGERRGARFIAEFPTESQTPDRSQ